MISPRTIAFLLVAAPLAVIMFMSRQYVVNTMLAIAAVVAFSDRVNLRATTTKLRAAAAIIAVVFLLKWAFGPPLRFSGGIPAMSTIGFLDYMLAYNVGQACIVWMVVLLLLRRGDNLPLEFPVYSAIALIMAGTIQISTYGGWRDTLYQSAGLLLSALTGLYFMVNMPRTHRVPRPRVLVTVLLITIVILGWGSGRLFYAYTDRADRLLMFLTEGSAPGSVGFPEDGRIDGINNLRGPGENKVALRIKAKDAPGYLRGRIYDSYSRGRWTNNSAERILKPAEFPPERIDHTTQHWFNLSTAANTPDDAKMLIEREPTLRSNFFVTLESERVSAEAYELRVDAYDAPASAQGMAYSTYAVAGVGAQHAPPTETQRKVLLDLAPETDSRIRAIATEITEKCTTAEERAIAVTRYLATTCSYDLNVKTTRTLDPVSQFLFDTHRGHCELFASAAVLLLRSAGVPCRYACGFVSLEHNPYGDYWVARNRDAHAWVEMWLDEQGWVTLEATPPGGVPIPEASKSAQLWDYIKQLPKKLIAAIRDMNFAALLQVLLQLLTNIVMSIPGALLLLLAIVWVAWRINKRRRRKTSIPIDPVVAAAQFKLRQMDGQLERAGLVRTPNETLHHFAIRIAASGFTDQACWYRAYAEARYRNDPDQLTSLRAP